MKVERIFSGILITSFIVIFSTTTIFNQDPTYYHNHEYKFRIKFPSGWEIMDGAGEHIIKKAVNDGNDVLVYASRLKDNSQLIADIRKDNNYKNFNDKEIIEILESEFDSRNFTESEFKELMGDFISYSFDELLTRFHKLQLLEKKITYIGNTKFMLLKFSHEARLLDMKINLIAIHFYTVRNGIIFLVGGGSKVRDFTAMGPIIMSSILTFTFEDWSTGETRYQSNEPNSKYSDELPSIILFIVIGIISLLLIGVILRIFYSKKGKEDENTMHKEEQEKSGIDSRPKSYSDDKNYDDIELYEEIDESSLSEEEKFVVYGEILGLQGKISRADITKAWKRMIEKYHPDKVSHLGKEIQMYSEKKSKDINKAYQFFKKRFGI